MVNGIRTSDPCGLNKGHGSKFREGSRVRQETPKEGRKIYRPKCWEYNNKNEDNNPKSWMIKILEYSRLDWTLSQWTNIYYQNERYA